MFPKKTELIFCIALSTLLAVGCAKQTALRNESIFPYMEGMLDDNGNQAELRLLDVDYRGMKGSIYIKSNVDDYKVTFQQDVHNHEKDWITFSQVRHDEERDCDVIDFEAKPMDRSLQRLRGVLNLSSKEIFYGKFIEIRQGFNARYSNDFTFLKYGSKDPLVQGNERPYEDWNENQKEENPFETTLIEGESRSHLYGRNGYVQLGNDRSMGADLTIPFVKDIRRDTAIVVSVNALAMPGDNKNITLEILGGGVFDGTESTVKTFEASDFNTESDDIWEGSLKSWVISSLDLNPITLNTRIKFTAGKVGKMEKNNRILLDNINIFSLPRESFNTVLAGGERKGDSVL